MRKLIIPFLLLFSLHTHAQLIPFMGIVPAAPAATPTVFWKLNFENEYQTTSPAGWQNIYGTPTNIATSGAVSFPSINTSTGGAPTIGFVNGSGFTTYYNAATPATANSGVFPDQMIARAWIFSNGATFTLNNLVIGQTYFLYVLSNAHSWEASTVTFTVAGVTSNAVNNSDNFGSSATSPWYTDASLCKLQFTATATSHAVTCNILGGAATAPINDAVLAK